MRGKAWGALLTATKFGITPAYAGKSACTQIIVTHGRDHPRVCGEKYKTEFFDVTATGSPPRMRGKGIKRCAHANQTGITPAYAGKRKNVEYQLSKSRDHPRVCGEKLLSPFRIWACLGSPPRMRGKDETALAAPGWYRITPAYAGKREIRSEENCRN